MARMALSICPVNPVRTRGRPGAEVISKIFSPRMRSGRGQCQRIDWHCGCSRQPRGAPSLGPRAQDVLITTDQNLRYQQNLSGRRLAILVLPTTSWPMIQTHVAAVVDAVNGLRAGEFRELSFSE